MRITVATKEIADLLKQDGIKLYNVRYKVVDFEKPMFILQCYKCQQFGHISSDCQNGCKCVKCGDAHDSKTCNNPVIKCVNCGGDHTSNFSKCKKYQEEIAKKVETIIENQKNTASKNNGTTRLNRKKAAKVVAENKTYAKSNANDGKSYINDKENFDQINE